ncbi:MAG: hypothetical protein J3Q66DRAFT_324227 [Benniella sp.]|nr:MAG: hypothetical protein J3Q66DRAFT_324227 [Benniella sp.]
MVSPLLPPDVKVCQELDELVLQYMTLIDQHLSALNRVGDRFQQGREQISQAKYIMGPRNVSADCYDHRMKALRGVIVNSPKDIVLRDLWAEQKRAAKEKEEEEAGQEKSHESGNGTGTEAMVDQTMHQGGLRRRGRAPSSASGSVTPSSSNDDDNVEDDRGKKRLGAGGMAMSFSLDSITTTTTTTTAAGAGAGAGRAGAADGESTAATTGTTKKKKKERNPDPLLWFGVFVPAPLRNAQSNFQKGKFSLFLSARFYSLAYKMW